MKNHSQESVKKKPLIASITHVKEAICSVMATKTRLAMKFLGIGTKVLVTRKEFAYPLESVVHWEREFNHKWQYWVDKLKYPKDYKTINTLHTPCPILIITTVKELK